LLGCDGILSSEKLLCLQCLDKFSTAKREYCPICLHTYPSDAELAAKDTVLANANVAVSIGEDVDKRMVDNLLRISNNKGGIISKNNTCPYTSAFAIMPSQINNPCSSMVKSPIKKRSDILCDENTDETSSCPIATSNINSSLNEVNERNDVNVLDDISDGMVLDWGRGYMNVSSVPLIVTTHILYTRHTHTTHTLYIPHTIHTLYIPHTIHTLCTPYIHTIHTLYTHYTHTMYTLCTHYIHTIHTLCTPYTHIIGGV